MDILALTCAEVTETLHRRYGKGQFHAAGLYQAVFRHGTRSFVGAPAFIHSPALAKHLEQDVRFPAGRITALQREEVIKFALSLEDDALIESVIIPGPRRTTLCLSTQVGCAWGCRFCATGASGFVRNLSTSEIVGQVMAARFELGHPVDNIVFMGMGEPLANFDSVMQAVRVIGDQRGLDIAPSHVTISTAGHVDGILRLAGVLPPNLRLAVSLNAANDELRNFLMPINRVYPLDALKEALAAWPLGRGGIIFIEYVLLAGLNDTREHAWELYRFLEGLPVRVNVIAYNGTGPGPFRTPAPEDVQRFCTWLAEKKLFVRRRTPRGQSILAACGQLGAALHGQHD